MDPRQKREDETWAEYGARMASMGVAPTPSPMLAGPMVDQFRPTGSDYTPQQLRTPIRQLQQQNIPQNVVPIRPMDFTQAGMDTVGLRMREQPSLIDIIDSREGTYGVSQDYRDFSPMMGTLADMAGDQPVYDQSVVTDMPSRPVFDLPSYSTSMPDVSQTLPADTQLRMLDDAMPTTIGPVAPAPFEEASFTPPVDYSQTLVDAGMAPVVGAVPGVSVAPSMQGVDYSQVMTDAGMAEVAPVARTSTVPGAGGWGGLSATQAQQLSSVGDADVGYNTGSYGPFDKGVVETVFDISTAGEDYQDYDEQQNFIESLKTAGFINATQAEQLKGQHLARWNEFLNVISSPVQVVDQLTDTDWSGFKQFWDAVTTGSTSMVNQLLGGVAVGDIINDPNITALIEEVTIGNIDPSELEAFIELETIAPGTVDTADIPEMISQVDTFKDIDKIAEDTAARQKQHQANVAAAAQQHEANVAAAAEEHAKNVAIANDKRQANKRAAMQKARKAQHKANVAAAKAKKDAAKRVAELTRQATSRAQAAQPGSAAEAQAARGRVAAAREVQRFMASRAYQEEGATLSAAMKDALAAGQVDTFADIGGWAGRSPGAAIDVSDTGTGPF